LVLIFWFFSFFIFYFWFFPKQCLHCGYLT
jgi:hypothetical protein